MAQAAARAYLGTGVLLGREKSQVLRGALGAEPSSSLKAIRAELS